MSLKIWIDGKLVDKADAKISVYDHGLLYGDGVFEGIRVYTGRIFECDAHLERLFDSAKAIRLTIPMTPGRNARRPWSRRSRPTASPTATSAWSSPAASATWASTPTSAPGRRSSSSPTRSSSTRAEMYEKGMAIITASVIRDPSQLASRRGSRASTTSTTSWPRSRPSTPACPRRSCSTTRATSPSAPATTSSSSATGRCSRPATADGILEGITRGVIIELCAAS